ncbi:NAD-dependent epimerase/dehydratase family protein [Tianweitania sp. BSSL-BM11]|uniref:NAD-dependent epimerase/dehydratase family protein n=1 Tax=Tianweitania aestuarii TaxID=2814886 RepID=A0ABS5RR32_9HYPH|nr:NAD-dependent epimerase/dehydratase family protein [Tianweitania aestuarii]MBS9719514.1 NAD-dependent epimerase/dehydratase family protein [Tianweitania aestuarii]
MKVAVTGANGFIGRHAVPYLAHEGHQIVAGLRATAIVPGAWKDDARIRVVCLDGQPGQFEPLLEGVDAVIHLAGLSAVPKTPDADQALQAANVDLTAALVGAAESAGVRRFLHLSSIRAVVGSTSSSVITDDTPPAPVEAYGRSKLESERVVAGFAAPDRLAVSLRPPLVIGADAGGNWKRLQQLAASGLPLPFGGINNRRSYLSVQTLSEALAHLGGREWPANLSGSYCLADPLPLALPEVIAALQMGMKRDGRLFVLPGLALTRTLPGLSGVANSLFGSLPVNAGRFFRSFGFEPNMPLVDAMELSGAHYVAASR